jgi:hypothetical protein
MCRKIRCDRYCTNFFGLHGQLNRWMLVRSFLLGIWALVTMGHRPVRFELECQFTTDPRNWPRRWGGWLRTYRHAGSAGGVFFGLGPLVLLRTLWSWSAYQLAAASFISAACSVLGFWSHRVWQSSRTYEATSSWMWLVGRSSLANPRVYLWGEKNLALSFICICQLVSNHGLTRFKRFVSIFTDKL